MANGNDTNMEDDLSLSEVSLESILAEYKGTAYINGDKRTPTELLNEQTERIISEALGGNMPDSLLSSVDAVIAESSAEGIRDSMGIVGDDDIYPSNNRLETQPDPELSQNKVIQDGSEAHDDGWAEMPVRSRKPDQPIKKVLYLNVPTTPLFSDQQSEDGGVESRYSESEQGEDTSGQGPGDTGEEKDSVILFFDNYLSDQKQESADKAVEDVENAVESGTGYEESQREPTQHDSSITEPARIADNDHYEYEEESEDDEWEVIEEPSLKDALIGFAERFSSISLRIIPAIIVMIMMIILTLVAEADLIIPFGIGRNQTAISGVLLIMLLIIMILCVDILIRGAEDLVRGAPNAETLVLFSCAFSVISCAFSMLRGDIAILPYCAVSAVSLTLAAYGERLSLRAIMETLKTAAISSEPYGIQAEYNEEINKSVLKKAYNRTDGFYSNLMHPDVAETAYRYAAPILLAAALVLSVVSIAAKGRGEYFLHTLSALLAAAAPFSAMLSFSIPFEIVVRSIRKSGAAIAGWGGVDDICFTDGASVTDEDLFPPGTLTFNGIKIYEGVSAEKAIRYTASLIIVSGSGLSRIFSEVLKTQKMRTVKVENFACYEGGVGALIQGENIITGSAAFMNLQGIRIPDDMNMKNAVFTAVNNELIAMFAIEYSPINSVQTALISMLKWRIKLFFAMRDFNVTPLMLEQKFRVSLEDIEYIQAKDSYSISDSFSGNRGRMAALLAREGLGPYAEAITGGRLLKSAALVATAVSVISAALGVLFMFYMCWNGSFLSAKPGNLLLFMLSTLAAVIIVCGYVKCKK